MITRKSTIRNLCVLTLLGLSLLPGCRFLQHDNGNSNIKPPTTPVPQQTAENLVNYLNTQASNIRTLSYANITLRSSEDGRDYPKLGDTFLFVSQPRNLRLVAGHSLAGKQLDVGSNEREFWIYAKPLPNQNYFYCSHDDFARGNVQVPIPFDTDWVMQALGMHTYPQPGEYQMETRGREYVLSQRTSTRTGVPITKVTYFNADHDYGKRPVVKRHLVQDDRGQVLASAEINQTSVITLGTDSKGQPIKVQVPLEVTLEWPVQKYKIRLSMTEEKVNEDLSDRSAMLFSRPKISGTNPIDLANYRTTPTSYRGQAPGNETRHYFWPKLFR